MRACGGSTSELLDNIGQRAASGGSIETLGIKQIGYYTMYCKSMQTFAGVAAAIRLHTFSMSACCVQLQRQSTGPSTLRQAQGRQASIRSFDSATVRLWQAQDERVRAQDVRGLARKRLIPYLDNDPQAVIPQARRAGAAHTASFGASAHSPPLESASPSRRWAL